MGGDLLTLKLKTSSPRTCAVLYHEMALAIESTHQLHDVHRDVNPTTAFSVNGQAPGRLTMFEDE